MCLQFFFILSVMEMTTSKGCALVPWQRLMEMTASRAHASILLYLECLFHIEDLLGLKRTCVLELTSYTKCLNCLSHTSTWLLKWTNTFNLCNLWFNNRSILSPCALVRSWVQEKQLLTLEIGPAWGFHHPNATQTGNGAKAKLPPTSI